MALWLSGDEEDELLRSDLTSARSFSVSAGYCVIRIVAHSSPPAVVS